MRGTKCWVVGSPGSRVFHTADAGHTWAAFATGSSLPLRAVTFIDDQRGWAVGDLGTILATRDGGRTWRPQCAGGTRTAVLALFGRPEDLPLEMLARCSGNDGYLGVAVVVGRSDIEIPPTDEVHAADSRPPGGRGRGRQRGGFRLAVSPAAAGLAISARQILDGWDRFHGEKGTGTICAKHPSGRSGKWCLSPFSPTGREQLFACLVRQIRTWRPDVILTCDAAVQTAIRLAA